MNLFNSEYHDANTGFAITLQCNFSNTFNYLVTETSPTLCIAYGNKL